MLTKKSFLPGHGGSGPLGPPVYASVSIQAVRGLPRLAACSWHCSLHYLFLPVTPLFPHGVIYCMSAQRLCTAIS